MQLDHAWIASHIPHRGAMCLIDEVTEWSRTHICCRTGSHRLSSNPLRTMGALRSECGIEYGAQAIAIHGALNRTTTAEAPAAGMLASIRDVALHVRYLDNVEADLMIRSAYISGNSKALMYDFSVMADSKLLLGGRATIVLSSNLSTPAAASPQQ